MKHDDHDRSAHANSFRLLPRLLPALSLLWRRRRAAHAAGDDPWDYAVAESELREVGLTPEELCLLIDDQYIDYVTLTDPPPPAPENQQCSKPGSLPERYLILAENGAALMAKVTQSIDPQDSTPKQAQAEGARARLLKKDGSQPELAGQLSNGLIDSGSQGDGADSLNAKPHWDAQRRELRYRGLVVKRFHKPAPNQELILTSFQELGWPQRIDDPLPPQGEIVPSIRLHDTLGRLNRTLQKPLLHFGSDGTGQGVVWKPS
jgi:hypothetical protein